MRGGLEEDWTGNLQSPEDSKRRCVNVLHVSIMYGGLLDVPGKALGPRGLLLSALSWALL